MRFIASQLILGFTLLLTTAVAGLTLSPTPGTRWWSEVVENRLANAGANLLQISKALTDAPEARREDLMTDCAVQDLIWLHAPQPGKQQGNLAGCQNNRFVITANEGVTNATVWMDSQLTDFSRPVDIELNGSTTTRSFVPSLKGFCETLARCGDPEFAFSSGSTNVKDNKSGRLVLVESDK